MRLQPRLKALYDLIDPCKVIADIGCDHALLPIALIKGKKCEKAYACDINELPLKRGEEAIKQANLSSQIHVLLTDGIKGLSDDVEGIVIAGMGYETIIHILGSNLDQAYQYDQIVLQCNNHVDLLRGWLEEHGFMIIKEKLCKDGSHYYQMIVCRKGKMKLNDSEKLIGLCLLDDPLFKEYFTIQLQKRNFIFERLQPHHENYDTIKKEIDILSKALNNFN